MIDVKNTYVNGCKYRLTVYCISLIGTFSYHIIWWIFPAQFTQLIIHTVWGFLGPRHTYTYYYKEVNSTYFTLQAML